jgi:hypothetical protein
MMSLVHQVFKTFVAFYKNRGSLEGYFIFVNIYICIILNINFNSDLISSHSIGSDGNKYKE